LDTKITLTHDDVAKLTEILEFFSEIDDVEITVDAESNKQVKVIFKLGDNKSPS